MTRQAHLSYFPASSRFGAVADGLRGLKGWRRFWIAFVFGSLTAPAYAPINFFPILWISFPALFFLLQGTANLKQAFLTGWSFAFGGFVFSLYWIADSMFVDIARFWWAVPLSVAGLPFFFAIYYGLGMMAARKIGLRGLSGVIIFALMWFLADYARGHVVTGFPWNLEGYTWTRILPMMQITSVTGIYGLTLLTVLAASFPACMAEDSRAARLVFPGSLLCLALLFAWGDIRLSGASMAAVPNVYLRLVQPNIDQAQKWNIGQLGDHFDQLLALSSAPGKKPLTAVVWPETAATFYLAEDGLHRRMVAEHVPPGGVILTGDIRRSMGSTGRLRFYNSMMAVDDRARIVATYDKVHLVPFGEYIPLRSVLPLRTLSNLGLDFSSGTVHESLRVPELPPFSPLICYEAIFPGEVTDPDDRPGFLLNITNDGWYGHTMGPYQHFAIARTRAIEEGLPLLRDANTGISAVVDAYGRMWARLGVGKQGVLDSDLPQALPPTLFSRWREVPLWILFGFFVAVAGVLRHQTQKARK